MTRAVRGVQFRLDGPKWRHLARARRDAVVAAPRIARSRRRIHDEGAGEHGRVTASARGAGAKPRDACPDARVSRRRAREAGARKRRRASRRTRRAMANGGRAMDRSAPASCWASRRPTACRCSSPIAEGPVGAAHAGWQGTTLRVAEQLVEAMVAGGAVRERLVASLGPAIGPCCYVIDMERATLVNERIGESSLRKVDERIVMDLWAANTAQLRSVGVTRIEMSAVCTLLRRRRSLVVPRSRSRRDVRNAARVHREAGVSLTLRPGGDARGLPRPARDDRRAREGTHGLRTRALPRVVRRERHDHGRAAARAARRRDRAPGRHAGRSSCSDRRATTRPWPTRTTCS